MRKIIYIICSIFILTINENINFIYAENDTLEDSSLGEIENNEGDLNYKINDENNNENNDDNNLNYVNGDDKNNGSISSVGNEVVEVINPINNENILNGNEIQDKAIDENDDKTINQTNPDFSDDEMIFQTFDYRQINQGIDTSDYGIIKIKDPNNQGKGITILDRNLGATTTGAGIDESRQSFGYYYQWGNNYGFSLDSDIITADVQVDASGYGPENPYSSDTFLKSNKDWSNMRNDNLRGGELDNGRGYPIESGGYRQGPCPENYHIPSIGERNKLLKFRELEYTGDVYVRSENNGLYYFTNNEVATNDFYKRFNIPLAGGLNYKMISINGAYFWSSSPINTNSAFRLYGDSSNVYLYAGDYRAYALPIRCFYNSYRLPVKITYDTNGGYRNDDKVTKNKIINYTRDDDSDYSGDSILGVVSRENNCGNDGNKKCMFAGWYNDNNETWTGYISDDITLYAKWLEYDDKNISLSGVNFSIMDRNLGSTEPGTGENSYGFYLSGGEDVKCPIGYHIPNTGELLGIGKLLNGNSNSDSIQNLLDLPFAGKIQDDEIIENGEKGYYLLKNNDGIMYAKISNSDIIIENINEGEKVSVRCFKDYNKGIIKFNSNGGDNISDINAVNWREEGSELQESERDNSIFLGWYTSEGIKIEKNINYKNEEEIDLYAEWECEEGYTKGEDKCNPIYFDITWIDGNENILKTDSVKWGDLPIYDGDTPTKDSTIQYKYTFNKNWLPEIVIATGNATYTAQFNEELNGYKVTINANSNSGTVSTGFITYYYGTPISINGNNLTIGNTTITATEKSADSQYTHSFSGWNNNCGNELKENCTIDAEFISTLNKYNVTINSNSNSGYVSTGFITQYYGTPISINGNNLTIGNTTITATEKSADSQYTHSFSGWNNNCGNELKENCTIDAEFISTVNKYNVTWVDGDNNILKTQEIAYGELPIYNGVVPTKKETQQYRYTFNNKWTPEISIVTGKMVYTAQFNEELIKKSGGSSGGGGGGKSSKNSANSNNHDKSANLQTGNNVSENIISADSSSKVLEGAYNHLSGEKVGESKGNNQDYLSYRDSEGNNIDGYTQEFIDAYKFAYKNKITTKSSVKKAKMFSPVTRIQMAKMLSNYAINVLGKQPDITKGGIKFNDVSDKLDKEYGNGVTLAYQLGIMGQNIKSNNFRPYDTVTRAEFSTVLSRLLFGIEDGKNMYYEPHIIKLYTEGIINNSNPIIKELRGYIMLMLLRSTKLKD